MTCGYAVGRGSSQRVSQVRRVGVRVGSDGSATTARTGIRDSRTEKIGHRIWVPALPGFLILLGLLLARAEQYIQHCSGCGRTQQAGLRQTQRLPHPADLVLVADL
jgi:hypothetical protein